MHISSASKLAALVAASILSLSAIAHAEDNNNTKDIGKNATNATDASMSNENKCAAGSTTDANGKCTTETQAK